MGHEYDALRSLEARLTRQEENCMRLAEDVEILQRAIHSNTTSIQELIQLAQGFKFGLKILGGIEAIAVWLTKLATAAAVIWALWRFAVKEALAHLSR